MIKILIIDDSTKKTDITKKFLLEEINLSEENIFFATNINDGRRLLYQDVFDLLLLDLVLPINEDAEATAEDSINFLNEIYYNSQINPPGHLIGFSQHENLIEEHSETFLDKLWHLIPFSFQDNSWKEVLKAKITYIISTKRNYLKSVNGLLHYDIGIVCALADPELKAIKNLNIKWSSLTLDGDPTIYYTGKITTFEGNTLKVIACSVNKMGMQASAVVSTMMVTKFSLSYIFMTGICAGLDNRNFNLGDILIAENAVDYGSGKLTTNSSGESIFKPELHQYPGSPDLINKAQALIDNDTNPCLPIIQARYPGQKPSTILKAKVVPMASGSYVVANAKFAESILEHNRKIIGVDMEAYSIYLTKHFLHNCKGLVIKSICDFADEHKADDFQSYASYTSATFLYQLIVNYL